MSRHEMDLSRVPGPAEFETLGEWLQAAVEALDTTETALMRFCGLSGDVTARLRKKPTAIPRHATRSKLAAALDVHTGEIDRLCGLSERVKERRVCHREGCGQEFTVSRVRRTYCSPECAQEAQRNCRQHATDSKTYGVATCPTCAREFQRESGNQKYCTARCRFAAESARLRHLGRRCGHCGATIFDAGVTGLCQRCRSAAARSVSSADAFSQPIRQWMSEEGLTYPEAACRLRWPRQHFYALVGKRGASHAPQKGTVRRLAERLGSLRALGWTADTWETELMVARLKGPRVASWSEGNVAWVANHGTDAFARALAAHICMHRMTFEQVGRIAHVEPTAVYAWLGTPSSPPNRPSLSRVAGAGALLAWPDCSTSGIEAKMAEVFELIARSEAEAPGPPRTTPWKDYRNCPRPAYITLRRLWEMRRDLRWLHAQTGLDWGTIYRYLKTGRASDDTRHRIASALELAPGDEEGLEQCTHPPRQPDVTPLRKYREQRDRLSQAMRTLQQEGEPVTGEALGKRARVRKKDALAYLRRRKVGQRKSEIAECFLKDTLESGPRPCAELLADAKALGIAERTLDRAAKKLEVKATADRRPKDKSFAAWHWSLPAEPACQMVPA